MNTIPILSYLAKPEQAQQFDILLESAKAILQRNSDCFKLPEDFGMEIHEHLKEYNCMVGSHEVTTDDGKEVDAGTLLSVSPYITHNHLIDNEDFDHLDFLTSEDGRTLICDLSGKEIKPIYELNQF